MRYFRIVLSEPFGKHTTLAESFASKHGPNKALRELTGLALEDIVFEYYLDNVSCKFWHLNTPNHYYVTEVF